VTLLGGEVTNVQLCDLTAWTQYHVEVSASTSYAQHGPPAIIESWTEIGAPDRPPQPRVNATGPGTITVLIEPATPPRYGPLSAYFIVVSNSSVTANQRRKRARTELPDPVMYFDSLEGSSGAVTVAQLGVDEVRDARLFVVGDGQTYGGYDNPPLQSTNHSGALMVYTVHYVVASSHDSVVKMNYSTTARPVPVGPLAGPATPWTWELSRGEVIGIAVASLLVLMILLLALILLVYHYRCRTKNDAYSSSSPVNRLTPNASWLKYYAGSQSLH